ncbi:MAG: hypothetical protein IKQ81_07345 [Clostridiales bacterium]|nr:hypothetical protein [Clostridiales bacterium]
MELEFGDAEKIAKLPQEGVHCYPGSAKKINRNRIVSAVFCVALAAGAVALFLLANGSYTYILLGGICAIGVIVSILVFCQTFLVAKYRVAVDYNEKAVVLRYRYSTISIPFENFDGRVGKPDEAQALIDKNFNKGVNEYLVLDDVFQDACYQTSMTDLESAEDFRKLRDDCFAIADAYGARNSKDKVKFYYEKDKDDREDADEDEIEKLIEEAKAERKEEVSRPAVSTEEKADEAPAEDADKSEE